MSFNKTEQRLEVDIVHPTALPPSLDPSPIIETASFTPFTQSHGSTTDLCHSFGPASDVPLDVGASVPFDPSFSLPNTLPPLVSDTVQAPYIGPFPGIMMAHGATTPSTASSENLSHAFQHHQSGYQLPPPRQPSYSHSTHPSTSSSSSFITPPTPAQGYGNMPVHDMGEDPFVHSLTRYSSTTSLASAFEKAQPQYPCEPCPSSVSMTTESAPRTPARSHQRTLSRPTPYSLNSTPAHAHGRHERSASISSNLLYVSDVRPSYWSPASTLEATRTMTVQERRRNRGGQSVDWSSSTPGRPVAMRGMRSSSMSILRRTPSVYDLDEIKVPANLSTEQYADYVHNALKSRADEILAMGPGAQQDKANNLWVRQWLKLSYVESDVKPVPRQGLHYSYMQACRSFGLKHIISASFGKAIKATFPHVKTRRLGHRGDSKYHLHLTATVPIEIERLNIYICKTKAEWKESDLYGGQTAANLGAMPMAHYAEPESFDHDEVDEDFETDVEEYDQCAMQRSGSGVSIDCNPFKQCQVSGPAVPTAAPMTRPSMPRRHTLATGQGHEPQAFVSSPTLLPPLPVVQDTLPGFDLSFALAPGSTVDVGDQLRECGFSDHQDELVQYMLDHRFGEVEHLCRLYWQSLPTSTIDYFAQPVMSSYIKHVMAETYDRVVAGLVKQIVHGDGLDIDTRVNMSVLTHSLRNTMNECLTVVNPLFAGDKLDLIETFAHILLRLPDLAQMSFTLSSVLATPTQVQAMRSACTSLDSHALAAHCWLSTGSSNASSEALLGGLTGLLDETATVSRMASWVDNFASDKQAGSSQNSQLACIMSEVTRMLSLRSDDATQHVQLLRLWLDEYVALSRLRLAQIYATHDDHSILSAFDGLTVTVAQGYDAEDEQDLPTAVPTLHSTVQQQQQQQVATNPSLPMPADFDWALLQAETTISTSSDSTLQASALHPSLTGWTMPKLEPSYHDGQ